MTILKLTPEQAELVSRATVPVVVSDPDGRFLATIKPAIDTSHGSRTTPSEAELVARALEARQSKQPTFTSAQVQAHLKALETAAAKGAGEAELRDLSKRLLDEAAA